MILEPDRGFVVATGIECSAPIVGRGLRRDELRLTGHWERYEEDAAIAARLGVRWLRYGIPFHVVAADPDRFDWSWTDRALAALARHGIVPIADLLHFGVPDDLSGVADPRLVERFVSFVRAFVERYPHVRHVTLVNEPGLTAAFSCREGHWNDRARDRRMHARALVTLARCVVEAAAVVREAHPDAVLVQTDVCERWIGTTAETREEAALLDDLRFVGWELAYGRRPGPHATRWLVANGVEPAELRWFERHGSDAGAIVGHDWYAGSEHVLFAPGRSRGREPAGGYADVAREYHARLDLPFLLSETNRDASGAVDWLAGAWDAALELVRAGLPIRGLCWYSLTDQVDWDSSLVEARGHVDPLGLVDLDRRERPVASLFRALADEATSGRLRPAAELRERAPTFAGPAAVLPGPTPA